VSLDERLALIDEQRGSFDERLALIDEQRPSLDEGEE
jgi:hypothetical protein